MAENIRLNKVLRELNISIDRAIDFLESKSIEIEKRPTTKISLEIYELLSNEFQTDANKKVASNELSEAKSKEKEALSEGTPCTQLELEEFYGDGRRILSWFKKYCSKFYSKSGYELVGIEIPLNANIKPGVHFIGYIDIVLKDLAENSIIIVDLKTSTMGWNQYQKADKMKNSQILLYKKYYSELFNVPLTKIKVEYQIMRRKLPEDSAFPIPYISKHVPPSGSPSVNKVYDEFMEFINTVFDDGGGFKDIEFPKVPGQNKKNCKWCEFMSRGICDGKASK